MKVLSGSARGRAIKSVPKSIYVRPILARIKKSLFDILRPRISGASFLDLYAGTGSVGIEALSDGAQKVTFVESNRMCVRIITENLERLGLTMQAQVHHADVTQGLAWLKQKFDIIFLGPPYHNGVQNALALTSRTLQVIEASGILADDGIVVAQHHAKENLGALSCWQLARQEKYGDTRLSFFEKAHAAVRH